MNRQVTWTKKTVPQNASKPLVKQAFPAGPKKRPRDKSEIPIPALGPATAAALLRTDYPGPKRTESRNLLEMVPQS